MVARSVAQGCDGQGVVHCLVEWAKDHRFDPQGKTVAIQGFGNVGSWTREDPVKLGVSLVATGDYRGYLANPEGVKTPHKLAEHVKKTGSVVEYRHGTAISRDEFFAIDCDYLCSRRAGARDQRQAAKSLKAKVIAEGANGPTPPDGDAILRERGIDVLPDILANAGGVTGRTTSGCRTTRPRAGKPKKWPSA